MRSDGQPLTLTTGSRGPLGGVDGPRGLTLTGFGSSGTSVEQAKKACHWEQLTGAAGQQLLCA